MALKLGCGGRCDEVFCARKKENHKDYLKQRNYGQSLFVSSLIFCNALSVSVKLGFVRPVFQELRLRGVVISVLN